jgi:hypothetical protein
VSQWLIDGRERLGDERAERAVLPRLEVARAPVVEQHDAEDVVEGVRPPATGPVAGRADHEAELELDVERLCGAEVAAAALAVGRAIGVPLGTTVPERPW